MLGSKLRTCLWFNDNGRQAAEFYVALIPDSKIESVGGVVTHFTLAGVPYMALDGGDHYTLTPAASIMIETEGQAETDRFSDALIADGGKPSMCGWLVDRFGLSWQVVPKVLPELLGAEDRDAAGRAREAMLTMQRLDIAKLEAAFRGE